MARGIVIPFTADVRQLLRGLKLTDTALDDLERALDDVGDESEQTERRIADSFADAARDAERSFERMERSAKDTDLDISDGVESAARSGRVAAGTLAGEVFDEFIESWSEAVRSGDYGDAIRETFSNLGQIGGAAFGPVGAVGGAVAGLFLVGIYDKLADTESRERVTTLAGQLFDAATRADDAYTSGFAAAQALRDGFVAGAQADEQLVTALGVDTVEEAWREVGRIVEATGLPVSTVTGAILGQRDAVAQVNTQLRNVDGTVEDIEAGYRDLDPLVAEQQRLADGTLGVLRDQSGELRGLVGLADDATAANQRAADAVETQARYEQQVTGERRDQAMAARNLATDTRTVRDNVNQTGDLDIRARVDTSEIDRAIRPKDLTVRATIVGATGRMQRLLDQGLLA